MTGYDQFWQSLFQAALLSIVTFCLCLIAHHARKDWNRWRARRLEQVGKLNYVPPSGPWRTGRLIMYRPWPRPFVFDIRGMRDHA